MEKIEIEESYYQRPDKFLVVIIYDISDNKRRNEMGKLLKGFGQRVQRSSFECSLSIKQYNKLIRQIDRFAQRDDLIRVYRLSGRTQVKIWGERKCWDEEEDIIFIIKKERNKVKYKLISFLGTSCYQETKYRIDDFCYESSYIQEALIHSILEKINEQDELQVFVLLTDKAKKTNYEHNSDREMKRSFSEIVFSEQVSVMPVHIPDGKTEEEIWTIFNTIFDLLESGDRVYMDTTHGFRSLPMVLSAILNYAHFIFEDLTLEEIFYGAYEAQQEGCSPVFHLKPFVLLQNWAVGADKFLNSGDAALFEHMSAEIKHLRQNISDSIYLKHLGELSKELRYFMLSLKTNRVSEVIDKALKIQKIFKQIDDCAAEKIGILDPFLRIIGQIRAMTSNFREEDFIWNIHEIAKLCYRFGMYQQTYTLVEENVINCLMKNSCKKMEDYFGYNKRESFKVAYKNCFYMKNPDQAILSKIDTRYLNKQCFDFFNLKKTRNDINHAGMAEAGKVHSAKEIKDGGEKRLLDFERLFL